MIWAAILKLLERFAPLLLGISVAALLALGAYTGFQAMQHSRQVLTLTQETSKMRSERDTARWELSEGKRLGGLALQAKTDENNSLAKAWQTKFNQAEEERSNESKRLQASIAAALHERDSLRISTAQLTSGYLALASRESCDPSAFRRVAQAAQTLGELLETSSGVSDTLGAEAEGLASQLRGVQAAHDSLVQKYK